MEIINDNEIVEPLDETHSVIQPRRGYRFGADAVALAEFASGYVRKNSVVFDLCSGCGIVGILVALGKEKIKLLGAEIDETLCDMSRRSAKMNGLADFRFYNVDIRDKTAEFSNTHKNRVDAVVCNPPYFKPDSRPRTSVPSASCELTVGLDDIVDCARRLLRSGGAFMLVYTCSRLDEALCACAAHGLTPKQLTVNTNGKTFLLRAVKGGKQGLTVGTRKFWGRTDD